MPIEGSQSDNAGDADTGISGGNLLEAAGRSGT